MWYEPRYNKTHHRLIYADDICFVVSSSEMLKPH